MVEVVLIPLIAGLLIKTALDRVQQHCSKLQMTIVLAGPKLFGSVFLLHATGFALGYFAMTWLGYGKAECRTVSIEVGMQNSGLGAALAKTYFADMAMAPIPAAISAVFHCLIGSAVAGVWGRSSIKQS
jgi:BASS family bile acid:Na+ symporter